MACCNNGRMFGGFYGGNCTWILILILVLVCCCGDNDNDNCCD